MKLPHTEVKFYPELKSQTGLSSLQVSCKRALRTDSTKLRWVKKSNLPKKTCWQKKTLLVDQKQPKCKQDLNSKRYKQPGEVEHSSCISSRNSPEKTKQNVDKLEDFERKPCEKILTSLYLPGRSMYITYILRMLEWLRYKWLYIYKWFRHKLPSWLVAVNTQPYFISS